MLFSLRRFLKPQYISCLLLLGVTSAYAQQAPAPSSLAPVTVAAKANRDPVEKSYRKMIRGMDLFEQRHALAPNASLRYKLLPRKPDTDMANVDLLVLSDTVETPIPIAPDYTFTLQRDEKALRENAQVTPNRKRQTMTWRTEIRTPGLPPGTRRLGDLRLECEVGMEAGLISNYQNIIDRIASAMLDTPAYCRKPDAQYYFFADRPIFSVTLVNGSRREVVPMGRLYAGASEDANYRASLQYCDCEVLLDRTYYAPLGDASWPDDTLLEITYMDGDNAVAAAGLDARPEQVPSAVIAGQSTRADVASQLGKADVIRFDSGYEVWTYSVAEKKSMWRAKAEEPSHEVVVLFTPDGVASKVRSR